MQVKVLRNLGRGLPPHQEGEVCELEDKLAESLCGRGLAEPFEADPPKLTLKGVPKRKKEIQEIVPNEFGKED